MVEYFVQLAKSADKNFKGFKNPRYSRKFDGKRMYIMDGLGYSRTGKVCYQEPIKHIIEEIQIVDPYEQYFIDGELLYFDNGHIENFTKGISLANSKEYTAECYNLTYVIFDVLPKQCFDSKIVYGKFEDEYDDCIKILRAREVLNPDILKTFYPHLLLARQYKNSDKLRASKDFDKWEGLMVRNGDSPYEFKRTGNLRKIKKFKDIELPVLDIQEGTGKYKGTLGAIKVLYKNNTVSVGSGFTDEQRDRIWNNWNEYKDKYLKIKYFEESKDEKGNLSLRFPTFLAFRDINTMDEFI